MECLKDVAEELHASATGGQLLKSHEIKLTLPNEGRPVRFPKVCEQFHRTRRRSLVAWQGDGDWKMIAFELHMGGPGGHQGHMCRSKGNIRGRQDTTFGKTGRSVRIVERD
jgi:hypothetical protein